MKDINRRAGFIDCQTAALLVGERACSLLGSRGRATHRDAAPSLHHCFFSSQTFPRQRQWATAYMCT